MPSQKEVVEALLSPQAYPQETDTVELIQTHISFVFLTKHFVYKVKKAVNFGFLDFSTLENRHHFCLKELELNRRLCPEIYLGVVPINKSSSLKIGGEGLVVEYALKMKRLPQERIMTQLLRENKITARIIDQLAEVIAGFHSKAQTNDEISEYGSTRIIKTNWDENFAQTLKYIDQTISRSTYELIQTNINQFIHDNATLFRNRIAQRKIKDCHGDLHSGNIFITNKICIFDAIEFNDRFRYSDAASDVAFLAMDLDFQRKPALSDYFLRRYIKYSGDATLMQVIAFYKCYRAYVRGKVISFKIDDQNIAVQEKEIAKKESQTYFELATRYAMSLNLVSKTDS